MEKSGVLCHSLPSHHQLLLDVDQVIVKMLEGLCMSPTTLNNLSPPSWLISTPSNPVHCFFHVPPHVLPSTSWGWYKVFWAACTACMYLCIHPGPTDTGPPAQHNTHNTSWGLQSLDPAWPFWGSPCLAQPWMLRPLWPPTVSPPWASSPIALSPNAPPPIIALQLSSFSPPWPSPIAQIPATFSLLPPPPSTYSLPPLPASCLPPPVTLPLLLDTAPHHAWSFLVWPPLTQLSCGQYGCPHHWYWAEKGIGKV